MIYYICGQVTLILMAIEAMSAAWLPVNETKDKAAHEGHPVDPDLHQVARGSSLVDLEGNFINVSVHA